MTPKAPETLDKSPAGTILRGVGWILIALAVISLLLALSAANNVAVGGGSDHIVGAVFAHLAAWFIPLGLGACLAFAASLVADYIYAAARYAIIHTILLRDVLAVLRQPDPLRFDRHGDPIMPSPTVPVTSAQIAAAEAAMQRAQKA